MTTDTQNSADLEQFIHCVEVTGKILAGGCGSDPWAGWSPVDQVRHNEDLVTHLFLNGVVHTDSISTCRGAWDARGLRPHLESTVSLESVFSPRGQFILGFRHARLEWFRSRHMPGTRRNLRAYYAYCSSCVVADTDREPDDYVAAQMLSWLFRSLLYSVTVSDEVQSLLRLWSIRRLDIALKRMPELVDVADREDDFDRALEWYADELAFRSTVTTAVEPVPAESEDASEEESLELAESSVPSDNDESAGGNIVNIADGRKEDRYRIYEHRYDEVLQPRDLLSSVRLRELRDQLDQAVQLERTGIRRMARRLYDLLLSTIDRGWDDDTNEGLVNPNRLDQVVANPLYDYVHRQQRSLLEKNTVVSLLIDNSASMRGRRILVSAICVEMIVTVLERFGIPTEVLGFTTQAWKGGPVREQWVREGRLVMPGRLNALRHIIFKDADTPMRRCRESLAAMINPDWMRENIDGEAIQWAASRLMRRSESRRFLVVISDGVPYDAATTEVNPAGFLGQHLADVISDLDRSRMLELLAIGIGYDVSRYYPHAEVIDTADELGRTLVSSLGRLLGSHRGRSRAA